MIISEILSVGRVRRCSPVIAAFAAALSLGVTPLQAQHTDFAFTDQIRRLYDGDRALATVAFLDKYVRWPGNRGFDASIAHIAEQLEQSGYVRADKAGPANVLIYRVEQYPMAQAAWEPVGAMVRIAGESAPLLAFDSNRNMLATNSYATARGGVKAAVVFVGGGSAEEWDAAGDVKGKIVFGNSPVSRVFQEGVAKRGAVGALGYALPAYLRPEVNRHSIQFASVSRDTVAKAWGIALSFDARERLTAALSKGPVELTVETDVVTTNNAVEQTVVAEVRGATHAEERFVFSAHVQEPGANDNASGVGAQLEIARVAAQLLASGMPQPARTLTMIWGQEIRSTDRFITQDSVRARGIKWGMSLDMVGEDTQKTGGTFLIEKMPDPSAIWTRGADKHTEWGGRPLEKKDLRPHYFNDYVLSRALAHAATTTWTVATNPFEGGSDHTPFLRANKPGLLLWHFTDQFYHTDGDRLDKVSPTTLRNVGVTALSAALPLLGGDAATAATIIRELKAAAEARLAVEFDLAVRNISVNSDARVEETDILQTWTSYYIDALATVRDVELGAPSAATNALISQATASLKATLAERLRGLAGS